LVVSTKCAIELPGVSQDLLFVETLMDISDDQVQEMFLKDVPKAVYDWYDVGGGN
jgi:hypothetical protein